VKFVGYQFAPGNYELDEEKKSTIRSTEMPQNRKSMMAVFFSEFLPNFSNVTSKIYDMITPKFVYRGL